ncbi:MAG TPA: hypothetical protein VJ863_05645 [Sphaerochaeta sp.]|nr:hypothetical protein [Sphaerochaeta sp.]
MKKSVRIHLLVITTVVAIFAFAGIWYLRPGVPNELLEQARARQLQPLLEIEAPIRKPVAEPVSKPTIDKKALAEELLPTLTEQVGRSLEGPLYEKLKKEFASDEAFISQVSAKLEKTLNLGAQTPAAAETAVIPQGLQTDFAQQLDALRTELLTTFGEGQSSFFYQIEGMLDSRLARFEEDLMVEMQGYVPQLVDRMIPSLVEMLVTELDKNKEAYLPYLVQEMKPQLSDTFTEEELLLLYNSYRDQIVADLVPSILTAMEEPARKEVAEMVKTLVVTAPVVPVSPPAVKVVVTPEAKPVPVVPVVETKPVPAVPVVEVTPIVLKTPEVPIPPVVGSPKREVMKLEPILTAPTFTSDEPEVFVDPLTYEQIRTKLRNKAIQDVLDRINAL